MIGLRQQTQFGEI